PHADPAIAADLERAVTLGACVLGVEVRRVERVVQVSTRHGTAFSFLVALSWRRRKLRLCSDGRQSRRRCPFLATQAAPDELRGRRRSVGSARRQTLLLLTCSRPCVKRPAWLFSARASVSSHSPTSSKPSSRAVRAN